MLLGYHCNIIAYNWLCFRPQLWQEHIRRMPVKKKKREVKPGRAVDIHFERSWNQPTTASAKARSLLLRCTVVLHIRVLLLHPLHVSTSYHFSYTTCTCDRMLADRCTFTDYTTSNHWLHWISYIFRRPSFSKTIRLKPRFPTSSR